MKKLSILTILLMSAIWCKALDYTYSTNLFYAIGTVTNAYIGTNATDGVRDDWHTFVSKLNNNDNWLAAQVSDVRYTTTNNWRTNAVLKLAITNLVIESNLVGNVIGQTLHLGGLPSGGGSYPDITDTGGLVGINKVSPAYQLDVNGALGNSASGNYLLGSALADPSYVLGFLGVGTASPAMAIHVEGTGGYNSSMYFKDSGTGNPTFYLQTAGGTDYAYFGLRYDGAGGKGYFQTGNGMRIETAGGGLGALYAASITNTDSSAWSIDSDGNAIFATVNGISDENQKTNIVAVDAQAVLKKILALQNKTWDWRDSMETRQSVSFATVTNFVSMPFTNPVTKKVNRAGSKVAQISVAPQTNSVASQRHWSGRPHMGPMAQDFSAVFGGATNRIDLGYEIGILLAGIQAIATPQQVMKLVPYTPAHSTSSTFGNGAGCVATDGSYLYVSTGTNQWSRVALSAKAW